MASTSVHLPGNLLSRLDELAAARDLSRNKLIVEACELLLQTEGGRWPHGFLSNEGYSIDDLEALRAGGEQLLDSVQAARRSKAEPPL